MIIRTLGRHGQDVAHRGYEPERAGILSRHALGIRPHATPSERVLRELIGRLALV